MSESPLSNPAFRWLFAAHICSLVGVGLLTVALSLAAFRIGGPASGGQVLGLLFALKMIAYVFCAPLAETALASIPRKRAMVALDLGRMLLLVPMTLVSQTWHIGALAFAFFVLAAGFTPLFQSVIPDLLPKEATYTKALTWSRVAYTMEAVLSPVIAAVLLNVVAGETLFLIAALAFAGSAGALLITRFPPATRQDSNGPFLRRAGRGLWIYRETPRLRGLFLLNLSLSLAMAWVLVNTVVYAGVRLGDAERFFPVLMAFYGLGAVIGALAIPSLLRRSSDRSVIVSGSLGYAAICAGFAIMTLPALPVLGAVWIGFGITSSLVLTPGALVITRSADQRDRAAVFAAQFSVSHAGWLVAYPLAGWLASALSLETALLVLAGISAAVALVAMRVWPADDPLERPHTHPDLPDDHPHLREVPSHGPQQRHVHAYHINDLHPGWEGRSI
ncbi:MAG: MFS transporter [Pseudomonadota bacterium]